MFRGSDGLAVGETPKRLRGSDLGRPFHGVRATREVTPVEAYAPRLRPGDRFSHTTAAQLWGAPVPRAFAAVLHVTATLAQRPRALGGVGHRSAPTPVPASRRRGLPVSDPVQLLVECGTLLAPDDLVAIADHLVLDPRILEPADLRPYSSRQELRTGLTASRGHGVRAA